MRKPNNLLDLEPEVGIAMRVQLRIVGDGPVGKWAEVKTPSGWVGRMMANGLVVAGMDDEGFVTYRSIPCVWSNRVEVLVGGEWHQCTVPHRFTEWGVPVL